ncbi:hypothetical protein [Piscinibacter sakaiensis]|uniref:hypothetical protein n=1 Tax=Piscinibacter sakaiensis TaxID=1547922 RepID=UPI003AAE7076
MADVGVLLVHGIGDHAEGETLLTFGDPLVDWLREWMSGRRSGQPRGVVKVGETSLLARRTEDDSPAYTVIELEQGVGGVAPRQERWLLAESWWGESVHPPGIFALLLWMFTRLPLLVVWHFFGGRRADPATSSPVPAMTNAHRRKWDAPVPDWLALAGKSVLAPLLILVMQAVVLVAGILSVVPFGAWREALLTAVRVMTLTLGDSFVLLEHDIQRAALCDRGRAASAGCRHASIV